MRDPWAAARIVDVAKRASVSPSAVSRVLNDHPDVSSMMREGVLACAEELVYAPDLLARSLRGGATLSVGFVVRDISNPLFADIATGAEGLLRQAGYSMVLTNSEDDPDLDARYIALLRQHRVDALILALDSESHPATLKALHNFPGPLVFLDLDVPSLKASAVLCDHYSGVQQAIGHLLDLGHEKIGLVAGTMATRVKRLLVRRIDVTDPSALSRARAELKGTCLSWIPGVVPGPDLAPDHYRIPELFCRRVKGGSGETLVPLLRSLYWNSYDSPSYIGPFLRHDRQRRLFRRTAAPRPQPAVERCYPQIARLAASPASMTRRSRSDSAIPLPASFTIRLSRTGPVDLREAPSTLFHSSSLYRGAGSAGKKTNRPHMTGAPMATVLATVAANSGEWRRTRADGILDFAGKTNTSGRTRTPFRVGLMSC